MPTIPANLDEWDLATPADVNEIRVVAKGQDGHSEKAAVPRCVDEAVGLRLGSVLVALHGLSVSRAPPRRQPDTVPLSVLTVKSTFSDSVPLPCRPLYALVPDVIVHREMLVLVLTLTT